jgi:predicted SAM-dependent methyltransferase
MSTQSVSLETLDPRTLEPFRLNLGCGAVHAPGWINVDGARRAWVASRVPLLDHVLVRLRVWPPTEFSAATYFADLRRPLPWRTASASAVYLGEVLEHLVHEDAVRLLHECFRVLCSGGVLRLRVPDNARFWRNYVDQYDAVRALPRSAWNDAHARWVEMYFREICVRRQWLGSFTHFHKWMWDEVTLSVALTRIGFADVERRAFLDSAIPDVAAVEVRDDLQIEATKPSVVGRRSSVGSGMGPTTDD